MVSATAQTIESSNVAKMTTKASIPSLLNCTLEEIAGSLDSDTITSVQLVKAYLARIEEVDYEFNSVIETNPDALSVAAELDVERSISGRRR
jgi:amidase